MDERGREGMGEGWDGFEEFEILGLFRLFALSPPPSTTTTPPPPLQGVVRGGDFGDLWIFVGGCGGGCGEWGEGGGGVGNSVWSGGGRAGKGRMLFLMRKRAEESL